MLRVNTLEGSVKLQLIKIIWVLALILVLTGCLLVWWPKQPANVALKALGETRQALRAQGYKTDLADFNLTSPAELRMREAIIKNTASNHFSGSFPEHPYLLSPVGNDSAMVVWKLDSVPRGSRPRNDESDRLSWDEFRDTVNQNQALSDPACQAILSGPIRFNLDASRGSSMLLPHLSVLKNLTQTFGDRTVLALHDGNASDAWANLLAATRLVTAYEPEPVGISHMVHFACAALTYNTVWQALQTNGWTDGQLARLQQEWESVNFFTNLPATAAFQRACAAATFESERQHSIRDDYTFAELCQTAFHSPMRLWTEFNGNRQRQNYLQHGGYADEIAELLYFRDREGELRQAVLAPTWAQMRPLPGVTSQTELTNLHSSRMQFLMNISTGRNGFQQQGAGLLSRAAEAEARRRIIITALALERYRSKHGAYPATLAELTPEWLKTPLPDFMDGQPLRYRLDTDGHFLLYSVGLDGVDNGGKLRRNWRDLGFDQPPRRGAPEGDFDLVWPKPNSDTAMQAEQRIKAEAEKTKTKVEELRQKEYLKEISDREWDDSLSRQSRVASILATNWSDPPEDPIFKGQSVPRLIGNTSVSGTNKLSLCALLTPKQIITG